jgi:hypothetical protein
MFVAFILVHLFWLFEFEFKCSISFWNQQNLSFPSLPFPILYAAQLAKFCGGPLTPPPGRRCTPRRTAWFLSAQRRPSLASPLSGRWRAGPARHPYRRAAPHRTRVRTEPRALHPGRIASPAPRSFLARTPRPPSAYKGQRRVDFSPNPTYPQAPAPPPQNPSRPPSSIHLSAACPSTRRPPWASCGGGEAPCAVRSRSRALHHRHELTGVAPSRPSVLPCRMPTSPPVRPHRCSGWVRRALCFALMLSAHEIKHRSSSSAAPARSAATRRRRAPAARRCLRCQPSDLDPTAQVGYDPGSSRSIPVNQTAPRRFCKRDPLFCGFTSIHFRSSKILTIRSFLLCFKP